MKYQGKHLLPFQNVDNKFGKFYVDGINWNWVIQLKV